MSVADVGCGEAKLLTQLILEHIPLSALYGIDQATTPSVLRRASTKFGLVLRAAAEEVQAAAAAGSEPLAPPPQVTLLCGSLSTLDISCDAILLVEVIEHLDPADLAAVGSVLLGQCAPHRLLVTTPNKEYNLNFMEIPSEQQPDAAGRYILPPLTAYPLRNADHKFEWTRAEFREWANRVAADFGYTVTFYGVGGGPLDEVVPYGEWRGGGPQTQVAEFERAQAAGAPMKRKPAVQGQQVFWWSGTIEQ